MRNTDQALVGMVIAGSRPLKLAYLLPGKTLKKKIEERAHSTVGLKRFDGANLPGESREIDALLGWTEWTWDENCLRYCRQRELSDGK